MVNIGPQIIDGIMTGTGDVLFLVKFIAVSVAVLWTGGVIGLAILIGKYMDEKDEDFFDGHYVEKPETAAPEIREAA